MSSKLQNINEIANILAIKIENIIRESRKSAYRAVNFTIVIAYSGLTASRIKLDTLQTFNKRVENEEAIAKYSVLNDAKQIFASKYKLTLPTEDELQTELNKARKRLELENGK